MGENESMEDRRFTQEETADLIRRATELRHRQDDELTYEQLIEIADEVGIDKRSVDEALREAEIEEAERATRASAVLHPVRAGSLPGDPLPQAPLRRLADCKPDRRLDWQPIRVASR